MRESWNNLWIEADTWWKKVLYAAFYIALFGVAFVVSALSGFLD